MARLVMMQGLPASGKSMRCAALLKEYSNVERWPLGAVRLNRDLLRTMLHCDVWSARNEGLTRDAIRTLARHFLHDPQVGVVIIDDTNLAPGTIENWKQLAQECGAEWTIDRLETPLETCLWRDEVRERPVGRSVIIGMALQYGLYPRPEKPMILCDIDGTLADASHRMHFLQENPKNWHDFFDAMIDDTTRDTILEMVLEYQDNGYEIFLVSGRPDDYRQATEHWLKYWCGGLDYQALFMRRAGDHRPDTVVKEEILTTYFPDTSWIEACIDDCPSILRMWESHGLRTIDVGGGAEF